MENDEEVGLSDLAVIGETEGRSTCVINKESSVTESKIMEVESVCKQSIQESVGGY